MDAKETEVESVDLLLAVRVRLIERDAALKCWHCLLLEIVGECVLELG